MKNIVITLVTLVLLVGGCKNKDGNENLDGGLIYSDHFVDLYLNVTDMELRWLDWSDVGCVGIKLSGPSCKSAREKYGDTYYNNYRSQQPNSVTINEFTSITVVSDSEFFGIAPGEPLNSLVRLCSASPLPYLRSGYKNEFNWYTDPLPSGPLFDVYDNNNYHPVEGLLSDLTAEDLLLLDPYFIYFLFTQFPSGQPHTLTVTFAMAEGEPLRGSVKAIFP